MAIIFMLPKGMLNQAHVILLGMCLMLIINVPAIGQEFTISIKDCNNSEPLEHVIIYDENNQVIAKTDQAGRCTLPSIKFPLFFEKLGYDFFPVYDMSMLSNTTCMTRKQVGLKEVTINANRIDLKEYLIQLRDKNLPLFIHQDTTVFYQFSYTLEIPEKDWFEKATGYIALDWQKHSSIWPVKVRLLQYKAECTDSIFWETGIYDSLKPLGIVHILTYDLMGNNAGYSMWQRLINEEKEGKGVPIPRFMIKKEHRELLEDVKNNPQKYRQYLPNNRTLVLKTNNGDGVFNAYSDTSKYIMEQVVFDSSDRMKEVSYFTPEQLPVNGVPLSAYKRNSYAGMSRINSDSSYYFSKYIYSYEEKPIMLKQVNHQSSFLFDGLKYRVTIRLECTAKPAERPYDAPLYSGLIKAKEVLDYIEKNERPE